MQPHPFIYLVYSCFYASWTELSSCNTDCMDCKNKNICYLDLYRKNLSTHFLQHCLFLNPVQYAVKKKWPCEPEKSVLESVPSIMSYVILGMLFILSDALRAFQGGLNKIIYTKCSCSAWSTVTTQCLPAVIIRGRISYCCSKEAKRPQGHATFGW